jgi:Zn-dependent protease with chaperone function
MSAAALAPAGTAAPPPVAPHRLAGVRVFAQVALYLLLFLLGFEGIRRSVAALSWLLVAPYAGSNALGAALASLALAFLFGFAGLSSVVVFFVLYLFWRSSRPAAVYSVSLGLYAWTALIALNIAYIVVKLPRDVAKLSGDNPDGFLIILDLMSIAMLAVVVAIFASVFRRARQELSKAWIGPETQPALWKLLEETARDCGVRLPDDICWIPKPNAQVMHVGGWLGVGGRTALGIGLPLLRVLTIGELRATLAHEFHHLRRGDALLFSSIYHARHDAEEIQSRVPSRLLGVVSQTAFNVYAALLLRLSRPVVRGWEFDADAFAGRVAGPGVMARALVKLELAQMRFDFFRRNWLDAVLGSGYLPPVMRGFWEYYEECALEERNCRRLITAREVNRESETHPPLRERVLRLSSNGSLPATDRSAFELVDGFETVEAQLYVNRPDAIRQDEWGTEMLMKLVRSWQDESRAETRRRGGAIDVEALAERCASLPATAVFIGFSNRASDQAERVLVKAFAGALADNEWEPVFRRGRLRFQKDSTSMDVAAEILQLKTRRCEDWPARCRELGIQGMVILPPSEMPGKGRFCSRCLRSFATAVEYCPVCRKRIYM